MPDQATTLCYLLKITRTDAVELGLTTLDVDVTYNGLTYISQAGYSASALSADDQLSVNNMEIESILDVVGVQRADIAAGLYDGARTDLMLYDYAALTLVRIVGSGFWGEATRHHGTDRYVAEFRSLAQKLQQPIGELVSPLCLAEFGDARCKVALGPLTVSGSVDSSTDNRHFTDAGLTQTAGWFDGGLVVWTSGANNGYSMEVKSFALGGDVELYLSMPNTISASDTFTIRRGCDKTLTTCRDTYSNTINRRAFDYVPGSRLMTERI
jgi:uncharacterized phage protein (TIGR02218 family)